MEYISASQLQKYEGITEKIKSEFEKYELLKKDLEKENDNLVISQLAKSAITQKLCHLNIQVFNKFSDLLNLYAEEFKNGSFDVMNFGRYKFYLIEIYITKSLVQKVRGLNCRLHIIVKSENVNINKTVMLRNITAIREIIYVDNSIINSTIDINLLVPSEFTWMVVKLDTVYVDISYHFQKYKEKSKVEHKEDNILRITESYNKEVIGQDLQKCFMLESKLYCEVENDNFISNVLRNSYHLLDLELFLELKNYTDKEFVLKLSDGREKFNLTLNKREKYLKMETNIYNLAFLRKYFSKEFFKDAELRKHFTPDLLKLQKANEKISQIPQEACTHFCEVREFWSKLPI